MRTAKEIMKDAFKEALDIVEKDLKEAGVSIDYRDSGYCVIAASNLAIALFSYEADAEALKEARDNTNDDGGLDMDSESI